MLVNRNCHMLVWQQAKNLLEVWSTGYSLPHGRYIKKPAKVATNPTVSRGLSPNLKIKQLDVDVEDGYATFAYKSIPKSEVSSDAPPKSVLVFYMVSKILRSTFLASLLWKS